MNCIWTTHTKTSYSLYSSKNEAQLKKKYVNMKVQSKLTSVIWSESSLMLIQRLTDVKLQLNLLSFPFVTCWWLRQLTCVLRLCLFTNTCVHLYLSWHGVRESARGCLHRDIKYPSAPKHTCTHTHTSTCIPLPWL